MNSQRTCRGYVPVRQQCRSVGAMGTCRFGYAPIATVITSRSFSPREPRDTQRCLGSVFSKPNSLRTETDE